MKNKVKKRRNKAGLEAVKWVVKEPINIEFGIAKTALLYGDKSVDNHKESNTVKCTVKVKLLNGKICNTRI